MQQRSGAEGRMRPPENCSGVPHHCCVEVSESAVRALNALSVLLNPSVTAHQDDAGFLARRLAVELGLAEAVASRVEMASRVHDIGLNGVDVRILDKAEPLTEFEYNILRLHPKRGADVMAAIPALSDLAPIVRSHHERFDGKGYPDGLLAEEIPIESRVLAVADAFLAMTSAHHWRAIESPFVAVQELLRAAGSQFDPVVVDAMVRVLGVRNQTQADTA